MANSPKSPKKQAADGMSLDQLSSALEAVLEKREDRESTPRADAKARIDEDATPQDSPKRQPSLRPRTMLEAVLFVGREDNHPITADEIAAAITELSTEDVDRAIAELDADYLANNCPYAIASIETGYRLELRGQFAPVRDRLQGRNRAAKLSPAAIEVLALVAYYEPLTAEQVSQKRGIPSGHILSQLLRRQLLRLERPDCAPRRGRYFTTPRFLEVFRLRSLDDLPRSDDLARQ